MVKMLDIINRTGNKHPTGILSIIRSDFSIRFIILQAKQVKGKTVYRFINTYGSSRSPQFKKYDSAFKWLNRNPQFYARGY